MSNNKYKILIVEDDHNIAELLQMYLEKEGYSVTVANDGGQGLNKFRAIKPDLVLLDIMLPGIDGLEVCNLNARHDSRNDIAALWAEKFSLIPTSGGDYHRRGDIENGGGIITDVEIKSGEQLVSVLRSGEYKIICPAGER